MKIAYIDFEYIPKKNYVIPVCACIGALDRGKLRFKKTWLLDHDANKVNFVYTVKGLNKSGYVFCCFYLPAEASGIRALGLDPLNFTWIDAQTVGMSFLHSSEEFRKHFQNRNLSLKQNSLLGFYSFFCGKNLSKGDKDESKTLILSLENIEPTQSEMEHILEYCKSDVIVLYELFTAQLEKWRNKIHKNTYELLDRFKNWSRYCVQIDDIAHKGIPINAKLYEYYANNYSKIVEEEKKKCPDFYVFDKNKFVQKQHQITDFIVRNNLQEKWPLTVKGRYKSDRNTLKNYAHIPIIEDFLNAQRSIKQIQFFKIDTKTKEPKLAKYLSQKDGLLLQHPKFNPFGTDTSRNAHTATSFIMAMDKSIRRDFFGCPDGMMIISPDYSAQEVWVAGALSGDQNLLKASYTDPFIEFGKSFGFIPDDATKDSHPTERNICKRVILANFYGQGVNSLYVTLNRPKNEIETIHNHLKSYCKVFFSWQNNLLDEHKRQGYLETLDGWTVFENLDDFGKYSRPKMMNFPVQSHGAVLLRKAVDLFYAYKNTLQNTRIIYTLHDEIAVLCPIKQEEVTKSFMCKIMQDACRHYFPKYEPVQVGFK